MTARFDPFWPVIGVPQLCRDEDILSVMAHMVNSADNGSPNFCVKNA
jgi:hypothetical protein